MKRKSLNIVLTALFVLAAFSAFSQTEAEKELERQQKEQERADRDQERLDRQLEIQQRQGMRDNKDRDDRPNRGDRQLAEEYAFVSIDGELFSNEILITIDLGISDEAVVEAAEYEKELEDVTSYVEVLNFMTQKGFRLQAAYGKADGKGICYLLGRRTR